MIQEWGSKYRLASGKDVPRGQPGHYDGIELLTKVDDYFLLIDGYFHAPQESKIVPPKLSFETSETRQPRPRGLDLDRAGQARAGRRRRPPRRRGEAQEAGHGPGTRQTSPAPRDDGDARSQRVLGPPAGA